MALFPPAQRRSTIAILALPIIGGMVSQNILNLIDAAMVGTLGDEALAAVGLCSMVNFLAMAFITGLAAGVQAMSARRKGEGRDAEMAIPLNGGLALAASIAIPWSILLIIVIPWILPLITPDAAIVDLGVPYVRARFVALVAVSCNFAFRGYWNGVNRSGLYMRTLIVMHVTNVAGNWLLIYGNLGAPELGATGAGIASALATFAGTAVYFSLGLRHARDSGFLRGIPNKTTIATMLRLAVPSGIQQMFFAGSMVALFSILSHIGTAETAAGNVLINVTLVALLPALGLGLASASLVGQALGRGDPDDAAQWGRDVSRIGIVLLWLLALPMLVVPDLILSLFIHEPSTLDVARAPLRLIGATMFLDGIGIVLMQSLMGAGATRTTMFVSITLQWGFMLPLAWLIGLELGYGLFGVWMVITGQRLLQAIIYSGLWRSGKWADVKV